MTNTVVLHNGNKKVVKGTIGKTAYLIGIDGKVQECSVSDYKIINVKKSPADFKKYLNENFTYNKISNEWKDSNGNRYTESYLEIKYLLEQ